MHRCWSGAKHRPMHLKHQKWCQKFSDVFWRWRDALLWDVSWESISVVVTPSWTHWAALFTMFNTSRTRLGTNWITSVWTVISLSRVTFFIQSETSSMFPPIYVKWTVSSSANRKLLIFRNTTSCSVSRPTTSLNKLSVWDLHILHKWIFLLNLKRFPWDVVGTLLGCSQERHWQPVNTKPPAVTVTAANRQQTVCSLYAAWPVNWSSVRKQFCAWIKNQGVQ